MLFLTHKNVHLLLQPADQEQDRRRGRPYGSVLAGARDGRGHPTCIHVPWPWRKQGREREARSGTRGFWRPLGASGGGGVPSPGSDQDNLAGPPLLPTLMGVVSSCYPLGLVLSLPLGSSHALGPCPLGQQWELLPQFPFLHQAVIPLRRESIWARTWQRRVSPLGNWGRGGGLWGDPSRWGRKARAPCELQGDTCHFLNGAVLMWTPETGPQKRLCSPGAACGVYQMRWYGPPLPTPPPRPQGPLASHSPLPQASAHPHCQTGGHSQGGPGGRCPNPVCGCEVSGGDAA